MSGRRVLPGGLVAAAAIVAALAGAPPAAAVGVNATWTGASTSSNLWTDGANWGGVAPGTSINELTFGDLATCDLGTAPAGSSCYTGTDNLGPATVNHIQIGGGKEYQIFPTSYDNPADTITLDGNGGTPNVGITAAPSGSNLQLANFGIPIVLGAAQEWDVSNYGLLYLNQVTGNYPLTLNLNNGYVQANDMENSSVTVSGPGDLQLDQFAGSNEKLPPVTVNDSIGPDTGLSVASTNATSGPITIAGTANNFIVLTDRAPGETRLQVNGNVTLDGTTNVEFDIDGNDTTPGTDASQLTTGGTVNFNGAQIALWQGQDAGNCDTLTPGKSFTLVQGGTLSGQIKVGGKLISQGQSATEQFQSNTCSGAAKTTATITYNATTITATIAGASGGSTGGSGGNPSGGGGTSTIAPALRALIRADLNRLSHPSGRRAIMLLLHRGFYRTRFSSPAAGILTVTWSASVRIGRGKHAKHRKLVIASGVAHTGPAGFVFVTIRLNSLGKRLLRTDPLGLPTIATERFLATGIGWTTVIKRFTL